MRVNVMGKNVSVAGSLSDYAEKKFSRLERYFDHIDEVKVKMRTDAGRHIVEATVPLEGIILRAEDRSTDMYAAIDAVADKLERQIEKYKAKLYKKYKYHQPVDYVETEPETDVVAGKVVKTKQFSLKPLSVEDAAMQMELLGHSFFVFRNEESMEVNVIYKRNDGDYGLLEAE